MRVENLCMPRKQSEINYLSIPVRLLLVVPDTPLHRVEKHLVQSLSSLDVGQVKLVCTSSGAGVPQKLRIKNDAKFDF